MQERPRENSDNLKFIQKKLWEYFESTNRFCKQAEDVTHFLIKIDTQIQDSFLSKMIKMYGCLSHFPYESCYDLKTKKFIYPRGNQDKFELSEIRISEIINTNIYPHYQYSEENAKRLTAILWIVLHFSKIQEFFRDKSEIIAKMEPEFTRQEREAKSYIFGPVQRLPRIELLFKELQYGFNDSTRIVKKSKEKIEKLIIKIQTLILHLNFYRELTDNTTTEIESHINENVFFENLKKLIILDIESSMEIPIFRRSLNLEQLKKHQLYMQIDQGFKADIQKILEQITSDSCSYEVIVRDFDAMQTRIKMVFLQLFQELTNKLNPKIFNIILKRYDELMRYFQEKLEKYHFELGKFPLLSKISAVVCNKENLFAAMRRAKQERESNIIANIHIISHHEWQKVYEKKNGAHDAGILGGVYLDMYNPERKVLFKRPSIIEVMIEFVVGRLQALINPDASDLFAHIELARPFGTQIPDEIDDNIYLASEFFSEFQPLYKDAYNAFHLPIYAPLGKKYLIRPAKRNKYLFGLDDNIGLMIRQGRYRTLPKLLLAAAFTGDPDRHTDNIGVIPSSNNKDQYIIVTGKDKEGNKYKEKVFEKVKAVSIDFGGGFSGKLDDKLHMRDIIRYLLHGGPPNYIGQYPDVILGDEWMLKELVQLSHFPLVILQNGINNILDELGNYFSRSALFEFAKVIGLINLNEKTDIPVEITYIEKAVLINDIKDYMFGNLSGRILDAHIQALQLKAELGVSDEEFEYLNVTKINFFKEYYVTECDTSVDINSKKIEKEEEIYTRNGDSFITSYQVEKKDRPPLNLPIETNEDIYPGLDTSNGLRVAQDLSLLEKEESGKKFIKKVFTSIFSEGSHSKMSLDGMVNFIDIISDVTKIGIEDYLVDNKKPKNFNLKYWFRFFNQRSEITRANVYYSLLGNSEFDPHPLQKLILHYVILDNNKDKILLRYIAWELTGVFRELGISNDLISPLQIRFLLDSILNHYIKTYTADSDLQDKMFKQFKYHISDIVKKIDKGHEPVLNSINNLIYDKFNPILISNSNSLLCDNIYLK
jgi:hypothetical protein